MSALFALAAHGAGHLAWLALHLTAKPDPVTSAKVAAAAPSPAAPVRKAAMSVPQARSQRAVTLAQGWWDRPRRSDWRRREREREGDRWWSDDDDDGDDYHQRQREREDGRWRDPHYGTYRTLCVRLCDGFYWPISYATTPGHFERDRRKCESSCGSPVRLYKYPNPGGALEDMDDLSGRPYSRLKTAFVYRTQYNPSCKCKADPWQQEALDRHRMYAFQAAKQKGDKVASQELEQLKARMEEARKAAQADRSTVAGDTAAAALVEAADPRAGGPVSEEGRVTPPPARSERMSLGRRSEPRGGPSAAPTKLWRHSADNAP